jgi:magnesium transporter
MSVRRLALMIMTELRLLPGKFRGFWGLFQGTVAEPDGKSPAAISIQQCATGGGQMIGSSAHITQLPGLSPGTLVHVGKTRSHPVRIRLVQFDEKEVREDEAVLPDGELPRVSEGRVLWIHVDGVHDPETIEKVGVVYGLHPLTMEDIVNTEQRPKLEDYETYLFLVMKALSLESRPGSRLQTEQVSVIIKPGLVLSFQEGNGNFFAPILERIRSGRGLMRKRGSDYLAYALIDAVVDRYFLVLETLGETIEDLQDEVVLAPGTATLQRIHAMKREMLILRRAVWPLREFAYNLLLGESAIIDKSTVLFLRDVHDHAVQIIDSIETYREMTSGMLDVYLSSINNRMNEIMKVLTIIATLFMPLTFISSIYGMNFHYMPELQWRWGYPAVLILMALIGVGMLGIIRARKWL